MDDAFDSDLSTADFIQLLTKHQCALNAFICSLVRKQADADDVMQETSLALWRKHKEFDASRDFFRWACGVAYIQVKRYRRKSATDKLWFDADILELLTKQMLENAELFDLRREALDKCLDGLDEPDQKMVAMHYQQSTSLMQLANQLGLSVRTIQRTMSRIRGKLQKCISVRVREWQGASS